MMTSAKTFGVSNIPDPVRGMPEQPKPVEQLEPVVHKHDQNDERFNTLLRAAKKLTDKEITQEEFTTFLKVFN